MAATAKNTSRILSEVKAFTNRQLGLYPQAVYLDRHDSTLTIAMRGILPEIERTGAGDKRVADLIIRTYKASFDTVRKILESRLAPVLGHVPENSAFMIDPQTNCATLIINLQHKRSSR